MTAQSVTGKGPGSTITPSNSEIYKILLGLIDDMAQIVPLTAEVTTEPGEEESIIISWTFKRDEVQITDNLLLMTFFADAAEPPFSVIALDSLESSHGGASMYPFGSGAVALENNFRMLRVTAGAATLNITVLGGSVPLTMYMYVILPNGTYVASDALSWE